MSTDSSTAAVAVASTPAAWQQIGLGVLSRTLIERAVAAIGATSGERTGWPGS